jgi:hypothetical protein
MQNVAKLQSPRLSNAVANLHRAIDDELGHQTGDPDSEEVHLLLLGVAMKLTEWETKKALQ